MLEIYFAPSFLRKLKSLDPNLQTEVVKKTEAFKDPNNHQSLKVHKLKGRLKGRYSFSVDYKNRIIFDYLNKKEVVFLSIGNHDVYKV